MRLTLIDSSMYSFCGISVYSSVKGGLASESEEKERERSSHSSENFRLSSNLKSLHSIHYTRTQIDHSSNNAYR